MKNKALFLFLLILIIYPAISFTQVYDVLVTESFDNTTNLSTDGAGFATNNNSCTTADMFTVSANHSASTEITNVLGDEVGSVFSAFDLNSATAGSPTELIVFNYTAVNDDEIGFAGNFALHTSCGAAGYSSTDKLELYYSLDGGATWSVSPSLTLTGNAGGYLDCSDGTVWVKNTFRTKEFSLGSGHNGKTIQIKVKIYGFTSGGEGFALDEFRLVTPRTVLATESFDNTTSLTTSSGPSTFDTPGESGTCDNNTLYDVSDNAATPTNITNCVRFEVGSVFILNHRLGTTAVDGEELEMLSYTATNNNAISFRGNFATFGSGTNTDNSVDVQYSTDNGASYTTAFTLTGGLGGPSRYIPSDGSSVVPYKDFITKGFPIGSGLSGQTIKIKLIFHKLDNNDDGIAFDEFMLEGSVATVLPISLLDFTPQLKNNKVQIDWTTSTEINNDYFTIEKSTDALNFRPIAIVDGAGNSNNVLHYEYIDTEAKNSEVLYYRLKQTDFNGEFSYSYIKAVQMEDEDVEWKVFPNPANQFIQVKGSVNKVRLYNVSGVSVYEGEGVLNTSITTNNLPSGTYIIEVQFNSGKLDRKVLMIHH